MNIFVAGGLWVAGAALAAGGIAYLVRRFGWDEGRADNNDAAGQVFTIVGGLHAVLVAFVLIPLFDSVGAVVWFALILGSLITAVLLPNLFGGTRLAAHIIIVSTLAGTITLLLFAIYQLQNPFSGGAKVPPGAFTGALDRLA